MILARRAGLAAMLAGVAAFAALTEATQAQGGCGASHTVQAGDTLAAIAERCGTTVAALIAANAQIEDPGRISVGWELSIPGAHASLGPEAEVRPAARGAAAEAALAAGTYEVRPGDSFASIATGLQIPMRALIAANEGVDPFGLRLGQTLRLPGAEPAAEAERAGGAQPAGDQAAEGEAAEEAARQPAADAAPGQPTGAPEPGEAAAPPEGSVPDAGEASEPEPEPESLMLQGKVLSGAECPVLKTPGGELYSLVSAQYGFTPGDYVEIEGERVDLSFCTQGRTTVRVTSMTAVRAQAADAPPRRR